MARTVSLDWNEILRVAIVATERAAAFLALGLRTADQVPPGSLTLVEQSSLRLLPDPLPTELARNILSEWRSWVVGAALRELDETYALFLERAFEALLLVESHGVAFGKERQEALRKFKNDTSTRKRLVTLSSRAGQASNVEHHVRQVSRARNILAHNAGIVRTTDCGDDGMFRLTWIGIDVVIKDTTGHVEFLRHRGDAPFTPSSPLPEDGVVSIELVERERSLAVGETVLPGPHDLHEICMMYRREADRVIGAIAALASARGIPSQSAAPSDASDP